MILEFLNTVTSQGNAKKKKKKEEEEEDIQIGMKEIKLFLLADNMIVYVVNSKECIKII